VGAIKQEVGRMAIVKCKECDAEIYNKAKSCPNWGVAPKKQFSIFAWLALICIGLGVWGVGTGTIGNLGSFTSDSQLTPKQLRERSIQAAFSPISGAHLELERRIKSVMPNPASYQHVVTRYQDDGGSIFVQTTYRGTNGLGTIVTESVQARADIKGNVLEILASM